jgi:hypothetical protein
MSMILTETLTGIYGPIADLDVVTELCLDDKHPRDLLTLYREYHAPQWTDYVRINGVEYRTDYRKDFPCGRPRSHTSRCSAFAQYLAELKEMLND